MDISDHAKADNIHTLPVPNVGTMRQHLEHLFGGYLDGCHEGLIELAWTDPEPGSDGRYRLRHAQLFGTDQLDEVAAKAAELNIRQYCNVYIGAALRKPDTFPAARANAGDILALTCVYVDLDDEGAVAKAKLTYGAVKPSLAVVTGRSPFTRAQCWWRLEEPITDPVESEALLKGMAAALGGDPSVTDPARVMRLAGSIAWPVKPGRQVEQTYIAPLKEPGQPSYMIEQLARLFPPSRPMVFNDDFVAEPDGIIREQTPLGFGGKVNDGRDLYLLRTIEAVLIQLIGESGLCPLQVDLVNAVWPQYSRNADLSKRGKGFDEVVRKCGYSIRRFQEGKINGLRDVREAKAIYARKKAKGGYARQVPNVTIVPPTNQEQSQTIPLIMTDVEFTRGFRPPLYLVDGVIQKGYLYSLTGPTGHGKTPISMLMGFMVARGVDYHGHPVNQGSVLFLAGENSDDIRARYIALAAHEGVAIGSIPFYFLDGVIDINAEITRIELEAARIPNLSLVIVDTDQAYFLGDEGNSNEQRKWFAQTLRKLLKLSGNPAGLVNCHPIKSATQDNLVPAGGGSFLNEIDGNIMCWADDRTCTIRPHPNKWRGVAFESMAFELRTITVAGLTDALGRQIPSVMAVPITEAGAERRAAVAEADEDTILRLIHAIRKASIAELAKRADMKWPDGSLARSKVQRIMDRLKKSKLIYNYRGGHYRLTNKGCKAIGVKFRSDGDENNDFDD